MANNSVWQERKNASHAVLTPPSKFTLDTILHALNKTVARPGLSLILIPALAKYYDSRQPSATGTLPFLEQVRELLFKKYKWAGRLFLFSLLRVFHSSATRYVKNNGEWRADKPNWRRDVTVVTGGSAGIGRAIVEVLSHTKKAKIAVLDLAPPTYAPAPPGAPEILYIKCDVTSPEQVHDAAEQIKAKFGRAPTILINNAGVAAGNVILKTDIKLVEKMWKIMSLSHWITLQEFLPYMINKNHGHVVSVASAGSYMALPQMGAYSLSKAAALALHEVLSGELRARYNAPKVRTTVVCPTKVNTALGGFMEGQGMQFMTPDLEPVEVGLAIVNALDSGLSHHIIRPAFMNILPFASRSAAWFKRIVELVGDTDHNVTDKSSERGFKNYKPLDTQ